MNTVYEIVCVFHPVSQKAWLNIGWLFTFSYMYIVLIPDFVALIVFPFSLIPVTKYETEPLAVLSR